MPKTQKNQNFDPLLIITQIILIFSIHSVLLTIFTLTFNTFFGLKLHIDQIYSPESMDFQSSYGYCAFCSLFFTNVLMIGVYISIVDKANKILDYVLTNFFIHLILTTLNSHFPFNFAWWFINGLFVTITTLISEYISLRSSQKNWQLSTMLNMKV